MNIYCALSFIIISFALYSCQNRTSYMDKAESVIEQHPDSALSLLDSMYIAGEISKEKLPKYTLLKIQAKDKLFQDITGDSLILKLTAYFIEIKDYGNASKASYYSGRYYYESGQPKLAMEAYILALDYAKKLKNNDNFKGVIETNIGYLLYETSEYVEALNRFKNATEHFKLADNIINQINIEIELGNCYMMLQECDTAYYYYNQSLELAKSTNATDLQIIALQNLSSVFYEQNKYDKAINLYKEALEIADDKLAKSQILLGITRTYYSENKLDSAQFFYDKTIECSNNIEDPYFKASLYNLASMLNEKTSNHIQALQEYKKYVKQVELISSEKERKSILEIQKKYQFEQVKNKHNLLQIQFNRIVILCLILITILSISSFVFHYIVQKKRRLLNEAENKIIHLDELALSYDQRRSSFKDILLHHFDILTKSTMIKSYLRDDEIKKGEKIIKKFNEIVYREKELDWQILYELMDESHNGFPTKLKVSVPDLDEEEFQICCLIYATDFKNQEIGLILKVSDSKITHKRSSIRRKIGMKEYSNIREKLEEIAQNISIDQIINHSS